MGCFETYCIVCGGPSSQLEVNDYDEVLAVLDKKDGELTWLDEHIGIPEDNAPLALGSYRLYGAFHLPGKHSFYTANVYDYRKEDIAVGDSYGLSCHAARYDFLHARLDYKLQFLEIWPLLSQHTERGILRGLLDNDYGGMRSYQYQCIECYAMLDDQTCWMLLDPRESEQNGERLLTLWIPIVESLWQAKRAKLHSMLTAFYCCFSRAHQLANHALCAYYKNRALWNAMGMVPSSLVHSIAQKADLILAPKMAVQKRILQGKK